MRGQKRVFVVDFDNTLFDAERFKSHVNPKVYKKAKKAGYFNPELLPDKYKNFFYKANFKKYLFPESAKHLRILQKLGRVVIFSFGDRKYQSLKIKETGIESIVSARNVFIVQDKKHGTENLIQKLKKEKFTDFVMFDDVAAILEQAFNMTPGILTVWIRYGKYKNKEPLTRNSVTFEAKSFKEAVGIIQRVVTTVSLPKSHVKFPVVRNIDNSQIAALITYTKRDKDISVCTHDDTRFKNKKTFAAWQKRGKIIYTLINREGKLLGIIWFAKKKYKDFPFTFAIRTYPPARGKGLSYKFLTAAYEDFKTKYKNPKLWLISQKVNIPAASLYKKFGFVKSEEKGQEIIMTLK